MGVEGRLAIQAGDQVDVWIMPDIVGKPGADFEYQHIAVGTVLEAVCIGIAGRESGGVAGAQDFLAVIANQHDFAGHDVDKFVAACVPVPLTGPGAGR